MFGPLQMNMGFYIGSTIWPTTFHSNGFCKHRRDQCYGELQYVLKSEKIDGFPSLFGLGVEDSHVPTFLLILHGSFKKNGAQL